jgi:GT2 family glycosyltransferase
LPPEIEPTPAAPRVSVVVVSHNRADRLKRCLDALGDAHQVIVIDNGSSDGSVDLQSQYPKTRFVPLPKNFGLTKALNIGFRGADGEYVLFLHEDTEISGDAVSRLADVLESNAEAGAVCPVLTDEGGVPVPQVRALPSPGEPDPEWTPSQGEEAVYASGAALMFRSFFLRALRNVDERYGNYGSDAELCAQVSRAGKKLLIVQSARAVHHGGRPAATQIEADRELGTAAYLGKHFGFVAGWKYRIAGIFKALFSFRLGKLKTLISGAKIDGK